MNTKVTQNRINSKLYSFIVAILPCVMMYKVPVVGKGFATVIVLLSAIVLFFLIHKIDIENIKYIVPGCLYLIYMICRSKGNLIEIILQIAAFIHLYAICSGVVDVEALKKFIINVSIFASICVIIQSIVHYSLFIHIPLINHRLCLEDLQRYTTKILTGMDEGIYRPSAFFLEPSHMVQYLMIGLSMCLLDKEKYYNKAFVISFGMVLTTSGMGIAILICIWGWFFLNQVRSQKTDKINMLVGGAITSILVILLATSIPGFQRVLARIFGSFGDESSSYNAIHGRLFWWNTYFSGLKGSDLVWGRGSASIPDDYFTGFMELLYAYGIVGVLLYYNMLVYLLCKSNNVISSCILLMFGALMVFANLTGFIHVIYSIGTTLAIITENEKGSKEKTEPHNRYQYIRH